MENNEVLFYMAFDAISYIRQVRLAFQDQPQVFLDFLETTEEYSTRRIDECELCLRIMNLFNGRQELITGFNNFLPVRQRMEVLQNGEVRLAPLFRRVEERADRAGRAPLSSDSSPSSSSLQTTDSQPNDSSDSTSANQSPGNTVNKAD